MKLSEIKTPISTLQGIGPETARLFSNLNIFTVADLLLFFPRDYKDRTKIVPLNLFEVAKEVHTVAQVVAHEWFGYGKMKNLKILIRDKSAAAELICFNRPFLQKTFPVGSIIVVSGSFFIKYNSLQCTDFEAEKISDSGALSDFDNIPIPGMGIVPIYPLTQGLSQKKVFKAVQSALSQYSHGIDNDLENEIIAKRNLLSKQDAIKKIHAPQTLDEIDSARRTLAYEELFKLQKTVFLRAYEHKGELPEIDIFQATPSTANSEKIDFKSQNDFSPKQSALLKLLPFELTQDQMNVILQMNCDIDKGYEERAWILKNEIPVHKPPFTMQRLLQGDVGSGKTLVALFACLRVIDWGGQCAFMAPTEILARQHAENSARLLEQIGVRSAFLSGNLKAAGRTPLLKALKNGDIDILVGTHALFSASTIYKDLQLAVIDEQHRFGVLQRNAIIEKGRSLVSDESSSAKKIFASPHLLMMSATPIPQTLALTVYGDLDISTIKTMPAGRKPITTYLVAEGHEQNAYNAVHAELAKGKQAYFVYPAIEENFSSDENGGGNTGGIKSAEAAFKNLSQNIFPQYKCALLHSKIPEEEQSKILDEFRKNEIQIIFATTVVEVGVDVPNATCMVIEQADRFGLSQLHQLRGRVGRGDAQSFCFLIYGKNITENGIARMKVLRQSTDGFFIAEEDLKLRGPGQITGTAQSGQLELGIADLSRDKDLLLMSRADAYAQVAKATS